MHCIQHIIERERERDLEVAEEAMPETQAQLDPVLKPEPESIENLTTKDGRAPAGSVPLRRGS